MKPPAPPPYDTNLVQASDLTKKSEFHVLTLVFIIILLMGVLASGVVLLVDYMDTKNNGPKCSGTQNCANGMYCVAGHCKDKCTSDKQCIGDKEVCVKGQCQLPFECTEENACPFAHFECRANKCVRKTCESTEDCPGNDLCSNGACFSVNDIEYATGMKHLWVVLGILIVVALLVILARVFRFIGSYYNYIALVLLLGGAICFIVAQYVPAYALGLYAGGGLLFLAAFVFFFIVGGFFTKGKVVENVAKSLEDIDDLLEKANLSKEEFDGLKKKFTEYTKDPTKENHSALMTYLKKYGKTLDHTNYNVAMRELEKHNKWWRQLPLASTIHDWYQWDTSVGEEHSGTLKKIEAKKKAIIEKQRATSQAQAERGSPWNFWDSKNWIPEHLE